MTDPMLSRINERRAPEFLLDLVYLARPKAAFSGCPLRNPRASNTVKEIEFSATLPALEIQRLAVDW
jgi:hypothetical protein